MAIFNYQLKKKFTIISNELHDNTDLSYKAANMLIYLLRFPKDWKLNVNSIATGTKQCPSTVYKLLRELRSKNYIHLHKLGFFKSWEYFVFNKPVTTEEFKKILRTYKNSSKLHVAKKKLDKKDAPNVVQQSTTPNELKKSLRTCEKFPNIISTKKEIYKKEIYKEKRAAPRTSAQASVLCNYFLNSIKNKKQDFVRDISPCWLTQADQLLNTRSVEQIKRVIDYAHKSEYWFARLLSMKALKNCLDTIELQMVHRFKRKIPTIDNTQTIEYRKSWAYQHEYTAPGGYAMALEDRYIVVDGGQVKELYYNADVPDWITLATNPIADQQLKCI